MNDYFARQNLLLMMETTKKLSLLVLQRNGGLQNLDCLRDFINGISHWRKIFEIIHVLLTQRIGLFLFNLSGSLE
jgi:hypothetical protein